MPLYKSALGASVFLVCCMAVPAAADWPQFMHDSQHTGDAVDQQLSMPLGLVAQVRLDDAVLTSPAIVAGKVFVVDQMGTAYCIDPDAGRIEWKSAPERDAAMGGNTCSPCVGQGRIIYGTTAGNLHILDAGTGRQIRSIPFGQPILGAVTLANESVYLQTLDAVVHCLDLDGNQRWQWDHYNILGQRHEPATKAHYGGVAVSVSGRQVVMAIGLDLVCVEDMITGAAHRWTRREPVTKTYLPVATTISGDFVYSSFPGKDGLGMFLRFALTDGSFDTARMSSISNGR